MVSLVFVLLDQKSCGVCDQPALQPVLYGQWTKNGFCILKELFIEKTTNKKYGRDPLGLAKLLIEKFSNPCSRPLNQYLCFSTKISHQLPRITSTTAFYLPEIFSTLECNFSACFLFSTLSLIGHLPQLPLYPCWWLIGLIHLQFLHLSFFIISTLGHPSTCRASPWALLMWNTPPLLTWIYFLPLP